MKVHIYIRGYLHGYKVPDDTFQRILLVINIKQRMTRSVDETTGGK